MADTESRPRGLVEGNPGESLFHYCLAGPPRLNELPQLFRKVEETKDHRLLAIVTALIVEDRLDRFLSAFMPRYRVLQEDSDSFTFSMKIRLAEALNFLPPLITAAAHCLRVVRNEFAHNLDKTEFGQLDHKILTRLRGIHDSIFRRFLPAGQPEKTLPEVFHGVAFYCIVALDSYETNARFLREHISDPAFIEALTRTANARCRARLREITSRPPQRVEQHGDVTWHIYEEGAVVLQGGVVVGSYSPAQTHEVTPPATEPGVKS